METPETKQDSKPDKDTTKPAKAKQDAPKLSAVERAKKHAQRGDLAMGTVVGLPEGHTPYWFAPDEVGQGRARTIRTDLESRGFELAPDAWVAGVTGAEVWACTPEVHAVLAAAKKQASQKTLAVASAPTN